MSDTNTPPKAPLWKQLLGALTGATIAVVLYQGYTFTSSQLVADVGAFQADVSSGPQESPSAPLMPWEMGFGAASSPPRRTEQAPAPFPFGIEPASEPFPAADPMMGPFGPEPHPAAMEESSSSQESSPEAIAQEDVPPQMPEPAPMEEPMPTQESLPEAVHLVTADVPEHGEKLPQSGFGLDLLAVTALGAVIGSRRRAKRA